VTALVRPSQDTGSLSCVKAVVVSDIIGASHPPAVNAVHARQHFSLTAGTARQDMFASTD
jgi:hypothetical protein